MRADLLGQQSSPELAAVLIAVGVLATIAACMIVAYVQLARRYEALRDLARWQATQLAELNNRVALIYHARPELNPIDAEEEAHVEWPADME